MKSRPEGIRILVERELVAPTKNKSVDEWMELVQQIEEAGTHFLLSANIPMTERRFADVKVLAFALLARTISNVKGAIRLLKAGRIVEARTITRCIFENVYWIVGIAEEGDTFVRKMFNDEMHHRRALGQEIFGSEATLEAEISKKLQEFMRSSKKQFDKAPTLSAKQVVQIRKDFAKSYMFYQQLSADAGHPSLTALYRYIVPTTHREGPGLDIEPEVSDREVAETCDYLCMTTIGVCVAAHQIIGETLAAATLNEVAERYMTLANKKP